MERVTEHPLEEQWKAFLSVDDLVGARDFLQQDSHELISRWGAGRYHNECGVLAAVLGDSALAKAQFAVLFGERFMRAMAG